MDYILLFVVIALLFFFSLMSINRFFIANILLAMILPTADRLFGGFSFSFAIIKYPVMFIGLFFHLIYPKIVIYKSLFKPLFLWLCFVCVLYFLSKSYSGVSFFEGLNFSGLSLLPLIVVSVKKEFDFDKFTVNLFNYVFLPAALFGIIQYFLGPSFLEQLGFTVITPNTTSSYSGTFNKYTDAIVGGLRPFSFFVSSADFAVIMFHACIWSYIIKPKSFGLIIPIKYMNIIFIIGLIVSQFITIILITGFCLLLYNYKEIKKLLSIKTIFKVGILVCLGILLFSWILPDPFNRIVDSLRIVRDNGGITSLGYRIIFILRYPFLISGHLLKGYGYMLPFEIFSSDSKILYFTLFTGIPIVILYVSILSFFIFTSYFKLKSKLYPLKIEKYIALAGLIFVAILINDLSNGQIEGTSPSNILVWVIGGVMLREYNGDLEKEIK